MKGTILQQKIHCRVSPVLRGKTEKLERNLTLDWISNGWLLATSDYELGLMFVSTHYTELLIKKSSSENASKDVDPEQKQQLSH